MTSQDQPRSQQPLHSRQYPWWHRVRRLRRWGFVLGLGMIAAPILTLLLQVVVLFTIHNRTPETLSTLMPAYVAMSLLYGILFNWTFSFMESRYHSTLTVRCPNCGYLITHQTTSRCSECGHAQQEPVDEDAQESGTEPG